MEVLLKSLAETERFGQQLAAIARPGLTIVLSGPLATGKTTLVRSITRAMGYQDVVTSPTYTLANVYPCEAFNVLHADFYRLNSHHEVYGLGLDLYLDNSLCIIEWGEKFIDLFDYYLHIKMAPGDEENTRRVSIDASHVSPEHREAVHPITTVNLI